jgi:hypothetical protein
MDAMLAEAGVEAPRSVAAGFVTHEAMEAVRAVTVDRWAYLARYAPGAGNVLDMTAEEAAELVAAVSAIVKQENGKGDDAP